jgi:putative transcriptional regulator
VGRKRWLEHIHPIDAPLEVFIAMRNSVPQLREDRGWTQGDLAARLKVSRQTINAVETERYEPSLSLAFSIAKLFGKRIEEIFKPG